MNAFCSLKLPFDNHLIHKVSKAVSNDFNRYNWPFVEFY